MRLKSSLKAKLKRKLPKGLLLALRNVRSEVHIWRLNRGGARKARTLYAVRSGLKLNIGCGQNYKKGWVNIDLSQKVDLSLDMREPIPLSNGSASLIYSEHFFQYLDYPRDAKQFLSESYRLLEPGGIFSIGVPNTQWPMMDYAGVGDGKYLETAEAERWHPQEWVSTFLDHINYHFRQNGEHRYAYDFETLRHVMEDVGFVNVREREFNSTLNSPKRRLGTLYVEGSKPKDRMSN